MIIAGLLLFVLFGVICAGGLAGAYTKSDSDGIMMIFAVIAALSGLVLVLAGLTQNDRTYENNIKQIRKDYPSYVFTDLTTDKAEYYNIKTRKFCKADVNKSNETNKYVVTNPYCKDK